mmetsp:Transcript_11833/g.34408  ORF Transcript_11833/g.34408 Transcript_11833/m.34408 type:complete len:80 (+) Transcript_11833:26-265(+)
MNDWRQRQRRCIRRPSMHTRTHTHTRLYTAVSSISSTSSMHMPTAMAMAMGKVMGIWRLHRQLQQRLLLMVGLEVVVVL